MAVVEILSWRDLAACRNDPRPFFEPEIESDNTRERREAKAKAICATCQVFSDCRADVEARPSAYGIYAGETAGERKCRRRRERRNLRQAS